jgi:hypothetical protein
VSGFLPVLHPNGGAKAAVRFVHEHLAANTFVFRTDVKSYYASIDHEILLWVILAPTRWKLREVIRLVNRTLAELHVKQHPDKTFIGRISRGFDFLGYAFTPAGLEVAPLAIDRCVQRASQLYEQGVDLIHIGTYIRRWLRWARSGLRRLGAKRYRRALGSPLQLTRSPRVASRASAAADPGGGSGTNR